jgi:hypothetical protein
MASSTKKLLVAISLPSGHSRQNDFLVPTLSPEGAARFVGVRSGKPALHGMMVYIGAAVTAADLLERATQRITLPWVREEALAVMEEYIDTLLEMRVGNVLRIESSEDGSFRLGKVLDRPPSVEPKPNLPG